jgi:hypothetical protein
VTLEELDPSLRPDERDRQMAGEGQASFVECRPVQKLEQTPLGEDRDTFERLELHEARLGGGIARSHGQVANG